ncbi:hypothetical protein BH10PLA2_BH10PLA2_22760 [soil metagenome]
MTPLTVVAFVLVKAWAVLAPSGMKRLFLRSLHTRSPMKRRIELVPRHECQKIVAGRYVSRNSLGSMRNSQWTRET